MKLICSISIVFLFALQANAYDLCLQTAQSAAKAIAKINNSHARIVTDVTPADSGEFVEVTLDNKAGGQSVTYTVTLADSDSCQVSKVEITGEE